MARLRNRIVKADYWGDGDLLKMPRDKRDTYRGLWAVAEDSGCLEDDPFTWKLLLWPGPYDADITVELITQWRDELVAERKLIPYVSGGRRFFFIEPFHRHEHPRNPQLNDLPLPPWVMWVPSGTDPRKGLYKVDWDALAAHLGVEQPLNNDSTTFVQALTPARPVLPCPVLPGTDRSERARAREAVDNFSRKGGRGRGSIDLHENPGADRPVSKAEPEPLGALVGEVLATVGGPPPPDDDFRDIDFGEEA